MRQVSLIITGILLVVLCAGAVFADESRLVFSKQTVRDKQTGLMWTRNANLGQKNLNGAAELVETLNKQKYAGFEDWRLPNVIELNELVMYAEHNGEGYPYQILVKMGFEEVQKAWYWTSSKNERYTYPREFVYCVTTNNGQFEERNINSENYVLPVRGKEGPAKLTTTPL